MTPPQLAFLGALTVISLGIVLYGLLVIGRGSRNLGVRPVSGDVLRRLGRSPLERPEVLPWAFYAHRISGLAIFAFLALHLVDVGLYAISAELYDDVHSVYGTPPMRVFESLLFAGILFHTLNGLRLLAIDLLDVGPVTILRSLRIVTVITIVGSLGGAAIIMAPVFT